MSRRSSGRSTVLLGLLLGLLLSLPLSGPATVGAEGTLGEAGTAARAAGVELQHGRLRLQVTALADDLLRVRIAADGNWPEDASWVVPAQLRAATVSVAAADDERTVGFRTAALEVRIERSSLRLTVSDLNGNVLLADAPELPVELRGAQFTLRKTLPPHEHYFGLGDKTGPLDRRGEAFSNWNTDAYHFEESTDPLYKSIPFFIGSGGPAGSYGVFLDNSWRSSFDFGKRDPGVLAFGADGGPIDYYVIYGPSIKRVVQRYTDLSGRAPLPPLWSLGFQQSRYSYESAAEVRAIAARLRAERLPADVIWLDLAYQDRNRPFTVDAAAFPDLAGLAGELHGAGLRLVAITDLHLARAAGQDYAPYDSGAAGDHFVRRADGSEFVGEVWPGAAVFPDFTRRATRDWWGGLYRDLYAAGVAGFWNDMNEPSVFKLPGGTMPPDVLHRVEEPGFASRLATHAEIHNVYGMQNARATFEGLRRLAPDERPFVMTRASFAGGQRYGATWTGDNSSTWNHLKLSVQMLLNLGLSGFGYSGADVGGYRGVPGAQLLTRWIQIGAFTPLFRAHAEKGTPRREPWLDGPAQTAIRRRAIEERYRLMPYIYALADENARTGAPLMRPVFYEFPAALAATAAYDNSFLLGERLLVAPSPDLESSHAYRIYLPAGQWFDYWSGLPVAAARLAAADGGGHWLAATPSTRQLPVFVRAGAILPKQPLVQSTAEVPRGPLSLEIYPGEDCRGVLYADDGHSLGHLDRDYLRQSVRCSVAEDGLLIEFEPRQGSYRPWWRQIELVVHGWSGPARAALGEQPVVARLVRGARALHLVVADQPGPARFSILRKR